MEEVPFVDFDPFPKSRKKTEEKLERRHEQFIEARRPEQQRRLEPNHRIPPERISNNSKKNRNLAKQLIITIKNMMNDHISFIQATPLRRKIIRQVWDIFYKNKNNLSKQILMVMFNDYKQPFLAKRYGLKAIIQRHTPEQFKQAMWVLKLKMQQVMILQNIRSHRESGRKMNDGNQLIAYVDKFIKTELPNGVITSRQNQRTYQMISVLARQPREQQFFINSAIQRPIEVFSE